MSLLDYWRKDACRICPGRVAESEKTKITDKSGYQLGKGWAFETVHLGSVSDQGWLLVWRILRNLIAYKKMLNACVDHLFTPNGARSETSYSRVMGSWFHTMHTLYFGVCCARRYQLFPSRSISHFGIDRRLFFTVEYP